MLNGEGDSDNAVRHCGGSVEVLPTTSLDLSDVQQVRAWAHELQSHTDRLDMLICTAAIVPATFTLAASPRHEMAYVTNHLGHFLLCSELYPLLSKSCASPSEGTPNADAASASLAESRIVIVSTDICSHMDTFRLTKGREWCLDPARIDDAKAYSRLDAYTRSKTCNVLFARRLAALTDDNRRRVRVAALHPGVFASEIAWVASHSRPAGEQPGWLESIVKRGMQMTSNIIAMKPHEQALTTLFAATSPELTANDWHGEYFYPYGLLKTDALYSLAKDDDAARELWKRSLDQVREGLGEDEEREPIFFRTLEKPRE